MTAVRFALPDGYSIGTHGRGYVFTSPPERATRYEYRMHFADDATRSPFPTPGGAVRAIIEHADLDWYTGLDGEARDVLLAEVAALPPAFR